MYKGIDISRWNKLEADDLKMIAASGYDFVIIRAGGNNGGYYTDSKFADHYYNAKAAGLKVGAYYDTGRNFISSEVGYASACHFNTLLQGKKFEMPVYFDIETVATPYKVGATDAAITACNMMENLRFYVGIYASDISGFKERLELERLRKFTKWVARYGTKPKYVKDFDMWQKSSTGRIKGINDNLDVDIAYVDFESAIKMKRLNGYT